MAKAVYIGTSGWQYRDWRERYYPKELKQAEWLAYYAKEFKSVEVNSTFYRLPSEATVANWASLTPSHFRFSLKLSQAITHYKRLKVDRQLDDLIATFINRAKPLGSKLAVILVQLPPNLSVNNERLKYLIERLKALGKSERLEFKLAVEFRHDSWFSQPTFELLRRLGVASVVSDSPRRWPLSREATTDFGYLRLHGSKQLYKSSYSRAELTDWAKYINTYKSAYCYFDNDHQARAVFNARQLIGLI